MMVVSRFCAILCTITCLTAQATIIDKGHYTSDSSSGLDWLDLSYSVGLSTSFVGGQFVFGGQFDGWRWAGQADIVSLFNNAGGSGVYDGSYDAQSHNLAARKLLDLLGDTYPASSAYRAASVHFQGTGGAPELAGFYMREWKSDSYFDILEIRSIMFATGESEDFKAHALVRKTISPIPEPSTIVLTLLGIAFLIGVTCEKSTRNKVFGCKRSQLP